MRRYAIRLTEKGERELDWEVTHVEALPDFDTRVETMLLISSSAVLAEKNDMESALKTLQKAFRAQNRLCVARQTIRPVLEGLLLEGSVVLVPVEYDRRTGNTVPVSEERRHFTVTLEEDEDGFIVASCPALPGCHSQGRTREEALANIQEALRGHIASMRDHGEPIPVEEVEEVEVAV